jgi:hypothetical protein
MGFRSQECRYLFRGLDFPLVALTVTEAQRVKSETLLFGYGSGGGGVESAAKENDRVLAYHFRDGVIFVPSTG